MDREEMEQIVLREKDRRLSISRIPKRTKEEFTKLAEEEFSEDYGMCLKWCLEQAIEYQYMKPLIFNMKLEKENIQKEEEKEDRSIKTLSGRELKGGKN